MYMYVHASLYVCVCLFECVRSFLCRERLTDRETDRQLDRQLDRQTDRQRGGEEIPEKDLLNLCIILRPHLTIIFFLLC